MKREQKVIVNDNGTTTIIETRETTPEDGVVPGSVIRPISMEYVGEGDMLYHKGYSKGITYTTSDPKIVRPFAYGICGIFLVLGIILLFVGMWFIAVPFIAIAIYAFIKSKKDIDRKAAELQKLRQHAMDAPTEDTEEKEI